MAARRERTTNTAVRRAEIVKIKHEYIHMSLRDKMTVHDRKIGIGVMLFCLIQLD